MSAQKRIKLQVQAPISLVANLQNCFFYKQKSAEVLDF